MHVVQLLDKWARMEARNQKRLVAAVGGLTAVQFERFGAKPKEAFPRKNDADMFEVLKHGSVRKIFTG